MDISGLEIARAGIRDADMDQPAKDFALSILDLCDQYIGLDIDEEATGEDIFRSLATHTLISEFVGHVVCLVNDDSLPEHILQQAMVEFIEISSSEIDLEG